MRTIKRIARGSVLLTLISIAAGCLVAEPREGYWDHDHHRYYHDHNWHECGDRDEHCH
ncbi:MAG TPA: hypothetical protein VHY75_07985 [Steroidobacteraceae bacterium]|nr:hypothetical protein [Steroidobacteraceae bacterium]